MKRIFFTLLLASILFVSSASAVPPSSGIVGPQGPAGPTGPQGSISDNPSITGIFEAQGFNTTSADGTHFVSAANSISLPDCNSNSPGILAYKTLTKRWYQCDGDTGEWKPIAILTDVSSPPSDTTAPSIAFTTASPHDYTTSPEIVTGTSSDNVGVSSVRCSYNNGTVADATNTGTDFSTWSYSVTPTGDGAAHDLVCSALDAASNSASATLTGTYTISSCGSLNFVGAPGATETFENGSDAFCTTNWTKTDSGSHISTYSTTYSHGSSHGTSFSGTVAANWTNFIRADLGGTDNGYSLEFWVKTPNGSTGYTSQTFFASATNTSNPSSINTAGALAWKGTGSTSTIQLSFYTGVSGTLASAVLSSNTEYRIVLALTQNASSTCKIYDSSGNQVGSTLTVTLANYAIRYLVWTDVPTYAYGIDEVTYDSTNP